MTTEANKTDFKKFYYESKAGRMSLLGSMTHPNPAALSENELRLNQALVIFGKSISSGVIYVMLRNAFSTSEDFFNEFKHVLDFRKNYEVVNGHNASIDSLCDQIEKIRKFMANCEKYLSSDEPSVRVFDGTYRIKSDKEIEELREKDINAYLIQIERKIKLEKACTILKDYVDYDKSYFLEDFLKDYKVESSKLFKEYCVYVLIYKPELFAAYEKKSKENQEKWEKDARKVVLRMNATLQDSKHSKDYATACVLAGMEYCKKTNLDNIGVFTTSTMGQNYLSLARYFLRETNELIEKQINNNSQYTANSLMPRTISEAEILRSNYGLIKEKNGKEVTVSVPKNRRKLIVRFMKDNCFAFYSKSYHLISKTYLNGEIILRNGSSNVSKYKMNSLQKRLVFKRKVNKSKEQE